MQTTDGREAGNSSLLLQLSSSNLGTFLEISSDALVLIDQADVIVMVNQQAEALFGYPRAQLLYQPLELLLPERLRDGHRQHLARYFSTPLQRPMEAGLPLFGLRQDGTELPLDISLKPFLLDDQPVALAAIRDLSIQRHMDQVRLNKILSATADYVHLLDPLGRFLFPSDNAAQLYGLSPSDFVGNTWQELSLPAEITAPFEAQRQAVMSSGQTVVDEILSPLSTGERWFEYIMKPMLDRQGVITSVIVVSRDITERRRDATALRQLASIVESSGDAIISRTVEGVITSWNRGAERLFGYRAEEAIGQPASLLLPPEQRQELGKNVAQITQGRIYQDAETTRVRKDGTQVTVSMTVSPVPDDQGHIIGVSLIAHDITALKQAEGALKGSRDELLASNTALEQANLARSQFLATMSHELRTPLASIMGFGEMLLEDAQATGWSQQQQSNLESILTNSEHLLDLINDVLDLSKIEAGRMTLDYSQVDPRALLSEVAAEIGSLAIKRHLFLKTEVQEGLGSLETNLMRVRQILLNLVSNALKFTEHGGVTLSASRVLLPDQGTEGIAFAVQDSGIGIPADLHEHIFEAFYQTDMSHTRKVGGTGLGLAIVSQLTALLGGTIIVASAPDQGSTFTVTLPLKPAHRFAEQDIPRLHPGGQSQNVLTTLPSAREIVPVPSHDLPEGAGQQEVAEGDRNLILAVDDNVDSIVVIKEAMRDTPYTVVGVQDPLTVMGLVQELHPCAITLDVMMPQLNGWQLLHQLKDNPATASIPVVMLTVLSEQMTGYVLGADRYLIKPFKKEVLRNTLEHLLEASKRVAQQAARGD